MIVLTYNNSGTQRSSIKLWQEELRAIEYLCAPDDVSVYKYIEDLRAEYDKDNKGYSSFSRYVIEATFNKLLQQKGAKNG